MRSGMSVMGTFFKFFDKNGNEAVPSKDTPLPVEATRTGTSACLKAFDSMYLEISDDDISLYPPDDCTEVGITVKTGDLAYCFGEYDDDAALKIKQNDGRVFTGHQLRQIRLRTARNGFPAGIVIEYRKMGNIENMLDAQIGD